METSQKNWINLITLGICGFLLVLEVFSLFLHQIVFGEKNREIARGRGRIYIKILGGRGEIRSADGKLLAGNQASFHLFHRGGMSPDEMKKKLLLAGISPGLAYPLKPDRPIYLPYLIASNIPVATAVWILARPQEYSDFFLEMFPVRVYRVSEAWGNILGYIGEISREELEKKREEGYIPGDWLGKIGLEKEYEEELRGTPGYVSVEIYAGTEQKKVRKEKEPIAGQPIHLTIHSDVHEMAYAQLQKIGKPGTVVLADAQTGAILAFASYPSFDPNVFLSPQRAEEKIQILSEPKRPLIHRASFGQYPPGSVFKLVVALAALSSRKFRPSSTFFCPGFLQIGDRRFKCWKSPGHGNINFIQAISHSCDVAFYKMALALGPEMIEKWAKILGLGQPTGIDFPFEKKGLVPSPIWKRKHLESEWYAGDTANFAIGQGYLLTTPLQVLQLLLIIHNEGYAPKLHLRQEEKTPQKKQWVILPREYWDTVKKGMEQAVREGTAQRCSSPYYNAWGKTGTAQVSGQQDHSWFAALAKIGGEYYAGVALVEGGGKGSATALPLLCSLFQFIAYQKNLAPLPPDFKPPSPVVSLLSTEESD
ncbi:MAG: penicillin-binding transpeptidase domain-containing protein [bacterium JZ-2024 1]